MATNADLNPSNGLQGSSYLYNYGTSPNTRAVISHKVRILTPAFGENSSMHQIGVVSSFSTSESRSVEPIRGIGFGDQIAELVPGVTDPMTASFTRAMLYLSDLLQATGFASGISGPVRSLKHLRWPFDIEQQMVFSSLVDFELMNQPEKGFRGEGFQGGVKEVVFPEVTGDGSDLPSHTAIVTMYEACWLTGGTNVEFSADGGIVQQSGEATISDIHDFSSVYGEFLRSGNDPTVGQLGSIRFSAGAKASGLPRGQVGAI